MPKTPWPGREGQALADGFLVPTDKRFVMRTREWRVIAFDDAIYEATGQQGAAVASSGTHVLVWGGERQDPATGVTTFHPGGAVFEEISSTHHINDSFYTDPAIGKNSDRKTFLRHWMS